MLVFSGKLQRRLSVVFTAIGGFNMCKEIDGVVYDTGKSVVDKKFTYGVPGDPCGYEETLYITSDGRYFIYTNGGIKSKYPNESVMPIAREDVKSWMLSH